MRHPAAYYLLLLYCTVLMRCAIPVACDALSHIFNEEEHLATIHAVYGTNHLQAEVAGTASDNHADKHTTTGQQDEPNAVHTLAQVYHSEIIFYSVQSPCFHPFFSPLCHVLLDSMGKPPQSGC